MLKINQFLNLLLTAFCSFAVNAQHFTVTSDIWEPFFMEKDGKHSGIGIEILEEIFAITGDTFSVVTLPMRRAERLINDGEVDLIVIDSPQWSDPKKAHSYVFSEPLMQIREHIYFHKDRVIDVQKPHDLAGKLVSIRNGYRYPLFDVAFEEKLLLKHEVDSDLVLLKLLLSQRTDAIFMDSVAYDYTLSNNNFNPSLIVRGMELSHTDLGIKFAINKEHVLPRINQAIKNLKANGTIKRIYEHYTTSP